jgi:hypothetical protein
MTWMSLYFSAAVWMSLLLASFGLVLHLVPRYRVGRPVPRLPRRSAVLPPLGRPRRWIS